MFRKDLQYYKFCLYGFLKNLRFFEAFLILFFLEGGLSFFECKVHQTIPMGTNTLFVGEILATKAVEGGDPLLYFNQKYGKLG